MIEKMDYVLVTKNDYDTLVAAVLSVAQQTNVNKIIVVLSSNSTDGTADICNELLNEGVIDRLLTEGEGLAYARQFGIQYVETKWFVFVDADVVLSHNWAENMVSHLKTAPIVSGIFGPLYRNEVHRKYIEKYQHEVVEIDRRMFTHNTILRTTHVSGWVPDPDTQACEDYALTQYIYSNGGRCFRVPVTSFHDHRGSSFAAGKWGGAGGRQTGMYRNWPHLLKCVMRNVGGAAKASLRMRNGWFFKRAVAMSLGLMWGYYKHEKNMVKAHVNT